MNVRGQRLSCLPVIVAGIAIHITAVLIAALPLLGFGGYLFAVDFCMFDIESPLFTSLVLLYYFGSIGIMAGTLVWERSKTGAPKSLLPAMLCYFVVAWLSLALISFTYLFSKEGNVYDGPLRGEYGVMAITLHTNQLVVPLAFGYFWRYQQHASVATEPLENQRLKSGAPAVSVQVVR